jgi:hypothetical protein
LHLTMLQMFLDLQWLETFFHGHSLCVTCLVICLHRICIWGLVISLVVASNSRIYKMLSMFISYHPNNMLHNMQQQVIKLRIIVMCSFILPWNSENIFFKISNAFSTRPSSLGESMVRWLKSGIWKSLI